MVRVRTGAGPAPGLGAEDRAPSRAETANQGEMAQGELKSAKSGPFRSHNEASKNACKSKEISTTRRCRVGQFGAPGAKMPVQSPSRRAWANTDSGMDDGSSPTFRPRGAGARNRIDALRPPTAASHAPAPAPLRERRPADGAPQSISASETGGADASRPSARKRVDIPCKECDANPSIHCATDVLS